ncbi:MAG: DMT family transporter [Bacteroidetes bacterium]|nr:MAG: DMT family transporter [Bacteroidota bacterium]
MTFSRNQIIGVFLGLLGTVLFSTKGILIKIAYEYQVDTLSLLMLRMGFSLPFYMGMILFHLKNDKFMQLPNKDKFTIFILGMVGYYLSSFLDFLGLQYISALLERLILFIYPTLVVLMSALIYKRQIPKSQIIALILTYSGISLALFTDFSFQERNFALGAGLVFLAAFCYAWYLIGSGKYIPMIGSTIYTAYVMIFACLGIMLHFFIFSEADIKSFSAPVYQIGLFMSLAATVLPSFMISKSISLLGADNAAIVATTSPITTIILAYFVLNESVTFWQIIGTVLVLAGVTIIALGKNKKKDELEI